MLPIAERKKLSCSTRRWNQRKDFAGFVTGILAEGNPGRRFRYFGELRAEGITPEIAGLLFDAGFEEVEVGLQSIEPDAMDLMDRKNNLRAFEKGVKALIDAGIRVAVDLIVGLPGDTVESVRRGLKYLSEGGLYSRVQVFNLAVLPGTAFRHEARELGLVHQPRPPYYVLRTPMLKQADLFSLMREAQDELGIEFDAPPSPVLDFGSGDADRIWRVNQDADISASPPAGTRAQAFTLWLRSGNFSRNISQAAKLIREVLTPNPFTTLQVVLEPTDTLTAADVQHAVTPEVLGISSWAHVWSTRTYLDKFCTLQPGRPNGAKRLVVVLPLELRARSDPDWIAEVGEFASLAWRTPNGTE